MNAVQSSHFVANLSHEYCLSVVNIAKDFFAYKLALRTSPLFGSNSNVGLAVALSRSVVTEGFTCQLGLNAFELEGVLPSPKPHWGTPVFVTKEELELAATIGFGEFITRLPYCYETNQVVPNQPFTRLTQGPAKDEELVFVHLTRQQIRDVEGNLLPVALKFCGTQGDVHSEFFDLTRVQALLSLNPKVQPLSPKLTPISILRIVDFPPFLESTSKGRQFIPFIFKPSLEDMAKIKQLLESKDPLSPTTLRAAVLELDLLGINEAAVSVVTE